MAIKINFDSNHKAKLPTLVLATKSGNRINTLPAYGIKMRCAFNNYSSFEFKVNYRDCILKSKNLWNQITDFKLVYCREYNLWFEIYIDVNASNDLVKTIVAKSLGEAELSQSKLYGVEVNTESDILRDDYKPTILYDENDRKHSLLHRVTDKVQNYKITHVDVTIAKIQRTFTFDNKTIYDALQEIGKEVNCLFIVDVVCDSNGKISREIKVYDLEAYCVDCGERGEFDKICSKCGSTNIIPGYGEDTTIYISTRNLAENIKYSTDTDSVKNCFKLTAGDDLMTATIDSCNPNGSGYIWFISDKQKEDMSNQLVDKLNQYDAQYSYYQNEHEIFIPSNIFAEYNTVVDKYSSFSDQLKKVPDKIVGYPALMNTYYDTIDLYLFLSHSLMPVHETDETDAIREAEKLTSASLSPVSIQDISKMSVTTASNAVLAMAKVIVDTTRYQVKVKESALDGVTWTGSFSVKSFSNEEDTATSAVISVTIDDDYASFVKQKLDKALSKTSDNVADVVSLFNLAENEFKSEIKKYSLSRLTSFHNACQAGLNILIEQGVSDKNSLTGQDVNLYSEIYEPLYNKLFLLEEEIQCRESEIAIVVGKYDSDGDLISNGLQNILDEEKNSIQELLHMENFLGEELWNELIAYRREDSYQNENYISDGLNNAQLFERALEFLEVAKKEIYKSSTLQHTISATLKNLLVMKEFEPLIDYFETGNWIRVCVDDAVYKLRLIEYEIDYENLENISVAFSDVKVTANGLSDLENIVSQAVSMATSYGSVTRQASQGKKSNLQLDEWIRKGLALTNMKIVDSADNQNITIDSHGMSCKEYLPELDNYDDKQLKLINRGLYLTDDNWRTSRAGIGDFTFFNPITGKVENSYGVIADTLIGNLILSEKVGIYNTKNSIALDADGVVITADATAESGNPIKFAIQKKQLNDDGEEYTTQSLYVDSNGDLVLNGSIKVNSTSDSNTPTIDDLTNANRFDGRITEAVQNSQSIIFTALKEYASTSDLESFRETISTQLSVLANEVMINVSQSKEQITSVNNSLQAQINEIKTNYRFTADGQYIGKADSDTMMRLINDMMQIIVAGSAVTTVDGRGLTADEANITTLHIGDYSLSFGNDGHLSLS